MVHREPPLLDLTPEGEFRQAPSPFGRPNWAARLVGWAVIVALIAGGLAAAALAFWLALTLIPIAIVAGLIAYVAFRFNLWRIGR
jgi:hypothetical protein